MAASRSSTSGPFTAVIPEGCAVTTPVVVIGGWAHAQDRHLQKFADLVASYGYPSVRSILPITSIFSPVPWPRRRWAEELIDFLRRQGLSPPRPIIFYSFSNGGAFVLEQVKRLAEAEADNGGRDKFAFVKTHTVGFVFDSAPAYMHLGAGMRVLNTSMPDAGLFQKTLLRLELWAGGAFRRLTALGGRPAPDGGFWEEMKTLDWKCPFLFLYSEDDPLCDSAALDTLIEKKRQMGQDISMLKWKVSGHCAHLKHHREEYVEALITFLDRCKHRRNSVDQGFVSKL